MPVIWKDSKGDAVVFDAEDLDKYQADAIIEVLQDPLASDKVMEEIALLVGRVHVAAREEVIEVALEFRRLGVHSDKKGLEEIRSGLEYFGNLLLETYTAKDYVWEHSMRASEGLPKLPFKKALPLFEALQARNPGQALPHLIKELSSSERVGPRFTGRSSLREDRERQHSDG